MGSSEIESSPTSDQRARRREQLIDNSIAAIRDIGAGASMEDIATASGVTKPILYRHFGDRDGLVEAIGERYSAELVDTILDSLRDAPTTSTLWATVDAFLALLESDPELYSFLMRQTANRAGDERRTVVIEMISLATAQVIRDRWEAEGRDTTGVETIAFGIIGMVHQAGDRWIRTGTEDRSEIADHLTDLLWLGFSGLRARHETARRARVNAD